MNLGIPGFTWNDLHDYDRLRDLSEAFDRFVEERGGNRSDLIDAARHLGAFLVRLFDTDDSAIRERATRDAEVARFKKEFVARRVAKVSPGAADALVRPDLDPTDSELSLARYANSLLGANDKEKLDALAQWAASEWKRGAFRGWTSFRLPKPLVFDKLVATEPEDEIRFGGPHEEFRRRDAFHLTDPRMTPREIADEAHYCIYCHERNKDSCSKGFPERPVILSRVDGEGPPTDQTKGVLRRAAPAQDGTFKVNPIGIALEGCPLDEKIGEMNLLRAGGDSIAALAMAIIDNPMCPGTGHRICNDCMRSCIFQKQEPVNIPQIETGVLTDVLFLPWGFEIYSLLTRWNPLNTRRPMALPYNGKNVLVVGLGPAGYTLAHYLANEGYGVVAIDGLKIEPLPEKWIKEPIRDARAELWDDLNDRVLAGFGGVSEYGITVRWDKNFLKVIRIALERKANLKMYGGVRFGGTITIEDAFDDLGFDHIAIAAGAGTPTIVRMKNNLIRGIRKASDFLMALQLTGAYKQSSMANLQVRLPAVVIGGGLTAIDTATELFAYYPVQVEKVLHRYETLCEELGEASVRAGYDREELAVLDEFLAHGHAVRAERERAAKAGEEPDFIPLVRGWGGVTIAYRKSLYDSPAYRLNYEEVIKSFEEGIWYAENLSPAEAIADELGHVRSIVFQKQVVEDGRWKDSGEIVELPARSVMVAAGTSPNVIYEKEHPGTFKLDKWGQFFQAFQLGAGSREQGAESQRAGASPTSPLPAPTSQLPPPSSQLPAPELIEGEGFFTSYQHPSRPDKLITFYGDNHPKYAGNVVKAMASARDGYTEVASILGTGDADASKWRELVTRLDDGLTARVHEVNRLTPTIVEVVVRAPFAAQHFVPGQFFRLQNFESYARSAGDTKLVMEGIALTGAWTDRERGLLSLIILEMGGSSRLCAMLQKDEPVVVMGPTGAPTELPHNETILLAGGGLGNAVLFSIAKALKDNGCRVLYFAGYKKKADVFKRDEIEAGTDQVIWSVDAGDAIEPRRAQDRSFAGNIVQSMLAYAKESSVILSREDGEGSPAAMTQTAPPEGVLRRAAPAQDDKLYFPLKDVTRIIAIGSDGMMRAVKEARHGVLAPYLSPSHVGIGSINSPMQCMMKQVCAQCLQRHVDPATGKESFVFSCFNQDQPLDEVDFVNLRARLRQNTVLEKMTNLWLTRLLAQNELVATTV